MTTTIYQNVQHQITTTMSLTAKALRENPALRNVQSRRALRKKVNELAEKELNPSTVNRCARFLQNSRGLYSVDDNRGELQRTWHDYFRR